MRAAILVVIAVLLSAFAYASADDACYNSAGMPFCSPADSGCVYRFYSSGSYTEESDSDGDGWSESCDAFPADSAEWIDLDGDGSGNNADCEVLDASIHPNAEDVCGNGIDEDCDGSDAQCIVNLGDGDAGSRSGIHYSSSHSSSYGSSEPDVEFVSSVVATPVEAAEEPVQEPEVVVVVEHEDNDYLPITGAAVADLGSARQISWLWLLAVPLVLVVSLRKVCVCGQKNFFVRRACKSCNRLFKKTFADEVVTTLKHMLKF